MSKNEILFFQRYHGPENIHSSNALLLLKRVYYYSPRLFYEIIANWIDREPDEFLPAFIAQDKGKNSVPDFSISQNGFKIVAEAKEKNNAFTEDQLNRHLDGLRASLAETKIFISLSPNSTQEEMFDKLKEENPQIYFLPLTYKKLYRDIRRQCDDHRDSEIIEVLEEYNEYCIQEKLLDDTDNTIMVRLAGDTIDFNVDPQVNIYYDKADHKYDGFRYLGLYGEKRIKYIGEIERVIRACKQADGTTKYESLKPKGEVTESEKARISRAMEQQNRLYGNTNIAHCYFLIKKFVPVENFIKTSKYALYGRKKFYLDQFCLEPGSTAEQIAERMKDRTWEEIDSK